MQTIDEVLTGCGMFAGMAPERIELIAGCASNKLFETGDYLMREGDQADDFYVIRRGLVAIETYVPQRGALTLETLHDGEVLGWSWLFPPHRVHFDARATGTVHSVAFDGRCLRGKCDEDHDLGYELVIRFAGVMVERLRATRMQLLDVYGHVAG